MLGALAPIYGTMVTSFIAMLIAVPVGIGIAIFLTELCPRPCAGRSASPIELLAGIPSHHLRHLGPVRVRALFLAHTSSRSMITAFDDIPVLEYAVRRPAFGIGIFTAGLILSIMVLPFISAVTRDVFETVPPILKEAAYGLGCTTWEVMWRSCCPTPASAWSAARCWRSAARWARPWRSLS